MRSPALLFLAFLALCGFCPAAPLPPVKVDVPGNRFVAGDPPALFRPWGLNYSSHGRLIEDFWEYEWDTVVTDFRKMKALGANVVRVHLQFQAFMQSAAQPEPRALRKLSELLALAETEGLYLDLTGLGCYRTEEVPEWYDVLDEGARWTAQAVFWEAIAGTCRGHSAVFCYNLMNEPLSPAGKREPGAWYSGKKLGGYDYLQMISLDPAGRTRTEIARQWIRTLTAAIRKHDPRTPITAGLLPTVERWGHLSGFIPAELAGELDFISGHIYPVRDKPEDALERTATLSAGKPVVIEETFAMFCDPPDLAEYLTASASLAGGWMMHFDGRTPNELEDLKARGEWSAAHALWAGSLAIFQKGPPPVPSQPPPDFLLRDGDTCVFLGDSITAARGYTKIVEHYTLMRFPGRQVRFYHAGRGGDTASGCLERLESDVFARGATIVTVAFGINDIGWGMKADEEHRQRYLDGLREIITRCRARGVRTVICSPAITAEDPGKAENGFLQQMADDALAMAREMGAPTADLQRGMRETQRRILQANSREPDAGKHAALHVKDGVHLNDLGQLAMAHALLRGLGAPPEVSRATVDFVTGSVAHAAGCEISNVEKTGDGLSFTRFDRGWPLNLGTFSALNYRWVPLPDTLNACRLAVTGLPEGEYELRAGGRSLGKTTDRKLAEGLDLSSMTADPWQPGGPWDVQSCAVKELVDARDFLLQGTAVRHSFATAHPETGMLNATTAALDKELTGLLRSTAKPFPYRMEIRKMK